MISRAQSYLRRQLPKNVFARGVSVLVVDGTAEARLMPPS